MRGRDYENKEDTRRKKIRDRNTERKEVETRTKSKGRDYGRKRQRLAVNNKKKATNEDDSIVRGRARITNKIL